MPTLLTLPNMEALVGGWLREHPDIAALDARVGPRTPDSMSRPWIRVTQLDATDDPASGVEHLVEYLLQLDCYAGEIATSAQTGQMEAWRVNAAAGATLKGLQGSLRDGVVITRVRFSGDGRFPDTALGEPARERYILTVELMAHGVPGA